jgi:hypothetical protein
MAGIVQAPDFLSRVEQRMAALGLNDNQVSVAVSGKGYVLRDIRRGSIPRGDRLIRLAEVLKTTPEWLMGKAGDGLPPPPPMPRYDGPSPLPTNVADPQRPFRAMEQPRDVPVLGSAIGTPINFDSLDVPVAVQLVEMGEVIDYVRRPPGIAHLQQAYALYVAGDSQAPRYEPGDLIYVNPRRPAMIGDDVVVQIINGDGSVATALVKRLVKRTSTALVLEQFNPPLIFEVPLARVQAEHRIMPLAELLGI